MHIAILIAGVADAKRPLERPASGVWTDIVASPTTPFKLSPFDEAALEMALKFRDKDPDTFLTVLVTDGSSDTGLMRSIAAHRIDRVLGLCPPAAQRGNPAWLARHALPAMQQPERPLDLILTGREHGDLDDGMTPAYLAECWSLPFVSLALQAQHTDGGAIAFGRTSTDHDETIVLPVPAFASISNDKRNRLRHPLMKNVMLAKQQKFPALMPQALVPADEGLIVCACEPPRTSARGEIPCQMLQGSVHEQARALASRLKVSSPSG